MILSWAVGNTDGHARNVSLLLTAGAAQLAPAYDVAPPHLLTAGTDSGLWIDGQPRLHEITKAHVLREMSSWGSSRPPPGRCSTAPWSPWPTHYRAPPPSAARCCPPTWASRRSSTCSSTPPARTAEHRGDSDSIDTRPSP